MNEMKGKEYIKALRSKWILYAILSQAFIAAGVAFIIAVPLHTLFGWSVWWGIVFYFVVFAILIYIRRSWQVSEMAIAQLLNERYPQLEESTELLLKSTATLNLLEGLQYKKTNAALLAIEAPLSIAKKIKTPVIVFIALLLAGIALGRLPFQKRIQLQVKSNQELNTVTKKEKMLPQVAAVLVTIQPPAYTNKPPRQQQAFNLVMEEGAQLDWQIQTTAAAKEVVFIFNDTTRVPLQPATAGHTQWILTKKIDSTGFYQLSIDGRVSELYKLETIADKSPLIVISSPKQYTTIEYGEPQQAKISTAISDDYGVENAFIVATIASGSGEAVKFKEEKIVLPGFIAGKTQYQLQQILQLQKMGMQPGDELYFYVQATDNHQQQTRSDIHILHLPDTAQLMSLEGLGNSLTIKPDYFRSQRQIIIETEQLLKDRDTISAETFKNKSNNLGIDQKLLRLRYGKFLGDASSGETEGADGLGDIADFSNAEKVADAFTDKHDNSDDATYLDPETKKQLRATLNEMWDAELHLRTFTPKDALPFEYKALRLLKELQQKSRVYVAKTNFKTTPLNLNKRLTADLSKISPPELQKDITQEDDPQQPVRNALSVLDKIKASSIKEIPPGILQQANLRLHEKAIQQPSLYLGALEALKRIMIDWSDGKPIAGNDILTAQYGLQQLLSVPDRLPSATNSHSKQKLSKQYFDNLQRKQP